MRPASGCGVSRAADLSGGTRLGSKPFPRARRRDDENRFSRSRLDDLLPLPVPPACPCLQRHPGFGRLVGRPPPERDETPFSPRRSPVMLISRPAAARARISFSISAISSPSVSIMRNSAPPHAPRRAPGASEPAATASPANRPACAGPWEPRSRTPPSGPETHRRTWTPPCRSPPRRPRRPSGASRRTQRARRRQGPPPVHAPRRLA